MKCPACKNNLMQKQAGEVTVDVCYGGCGGIWFDARELERVDARGATTLHTIWQAPSKRAASVEPRLCPRCPEQVMARRQFPGAERIEIDECPTCGGLWLDDGEFTRVYDAIKGARMTIPGLGPAIEAAARYARPSASA